MSVIPLQQSFQCKKCKSDEISITEGNSNPEQLIQRALNNGVQVGRIVYKCLDCEHRGYIVFNLKIES